jgi:hypothetical protein
MHDLLMGHVPEHYHRRRRHDPTHDRRVVARKATAAPTPDPRSGSNGRRRPAKIEHPSREERAAVGEELASAYRSTRTPHS